MGQGIISRSNPGNTGDKVGDIRITTRNTLGEKWALCNGERIPDGSDYKNIDPTDYSHWGEYSSSIRDSEFQLYDAKVFSNGDIKCLHHDSSGNSFRVKSISADGSYTTVTIFGENGDPEFIDIELYEDLNGSGIYAVMLYSNGSRYRVLDISLSRSFDEAEVYSGTYKGYGTSSRTVIGLFNKKLIWFDTDRCLFLEEKAIMGPCQYSGFECLSCNSADYFILIDINVHPDYLYCDLYKCLDDHATISSITHISLNADSPRLKGSPIYDKKNNYIYICTHTEFIRVDFSNNSKQTLYTISGYDKFDGSILGTVLYDNEIKVFYLDASAYGIFIGDASTLTDLSSVNELDQVCSADCSEELKGPFVYDPSVPASIHTTIIQYNGGSVYRLTGGYHLPTISVDDESYCFIKIKD